VDEHGFSRIKISPSTHVYSHFIGAPPGNIVDLSTGLNKSEARNPKSRGSKQIQNSNAKNSKQKLLRLQ
jgi:hypothetical protein